MGAKLPSGLPRLDSLKHLDEARFSLIQEVRELEHKADQLDTIVATIQVNFGKEIGRTLKIADKKDSPVDQLLTVLRHLLNEQQKETATNDGGNTAGCMVGERSAETPS